MSALPEFRHFLLTSFLLYDTFLKGGGFFTGFVRDFRGFGGRLFRGILVTVGRDDGR